MSLKTPQADINQKLHQSAQLTPYIVEGVLTGTIGAQTIRISAVSGGGGGSSKLPTNQTLKDAFLGSFQNQGSASSKESGRGGPLPPGKYTI